MKKFFALMLSFFVILQIVNLPFVQANTSGSGTVKDWSIGQDAIDFITQVQLYVREDQQSSLLFNSLDPTVVHNSEPIEKDADIELRFGLKLPNNHAVKANDIFIIPLPAEINAIPGTQTTLKTNDGTDVVDAIITPDHALQITFKPFVVGNSNIVGELRLAMKFDESKIGNQNPTEVKFTIPGNTVNEYKIPINYKVDKPSIQKSGNYSNTNNVIEWKVAINKEIAIANNARVVDIIPYGLILDEATITVNPPITGATHTYDATTGVLEYIFPSTIDDFYELSYETSIQNELLLDPANNGKKLKFKNNAQLTYDGSANNLFASAEVETVEVELFSKLGQYDETAKDVWWEFEINKAGGFIEDALFIDELPQYLTLDESSITYVKGGAGTPYTIQSKAVGANGRQNVKLQLGNIDAAATLKFRTTVSDEFYKSIRSTGQFDNTAQIISQGSGTFNVSARDVVGNVKVALINKYSSGYDRRNGQFEWKVEVNPNHLDLTNMVIEDDLGPGHEYISSSINIAITDKATKTTTTYTPDQINAASNAHLGMKFEFLDANNAETANMAEAVKWKLSATSTKSDQFIITMKTQVLDTNVYKSNNTTSTYTNHATLSATELSQPMIKNALGTVNSEVLRKEFVDYNYATRTFTWRVVVNENGNALSNVHITDVIPSGMEYVPNSFKIDGTAITPTLNDVSGVKQLEYTYPTLNSKSIMTFEMKLTDEHVNATFVENKHYKYTNTAVLKHDEIADPQTSSASYDVKNVVVGKEGNYTTNKNYVDWVVNINSNSVNYSSFIDATGQLVIRDQLSSNLKLDTSSIKFYGQTINPNGSYQRGALVNDVYNTDHIKYNDSTRLFEFVLPNVVDKGYRLEFRTYITAPGAVNNAVEFSGVSISHQNQSAQIMSSWNTLSGSMQGETGTIKVVKVDNTAAKKPLAGAKFVLIDLYGYEIDTMTTDANGELKFTNLRFDVPYKVKEVEAPVGYVLDRAISDDIILVDAVGKREVVFEKVNVPNKGTIQFTKMGYDNVLLEGAEFTLYDANGAPIQVQVSNANGEVKFVGVPYGSYTIKETKAPNGYRLSSQVLTASIVLNQEIVVASSPIVNNDIQRGSISLTKVDNETSERLEGVVFGLYKHTDTALTSPLLTESTDGNGELTFSNVPFGEYLIKELQPKAGYLANETVYTAKVQGDGSVDNIGNIGNQIAKGTITFNKVGLNGVALEGAQFILYDNKGTAIGSAISNVQGKVEFTQVRYGSYTIRETLAPVGYHLSSQALTATISVDKEIVVASPGSFSNEIYRSDIKVTKVSKTGELLSGAQFAIYDVADTDFLNVLATATSDSDGIALFENIPYGQYVITETNAPRGYLINRATLTVTVDKDREVYDLGQFENEIAPSMLYYGKAGVKKVDENNKPLAGAKFGLYDTNGKLVTTTVTGANGVGSFENVLLGSYVLKEIEAPTGYLLSTEAYKVDILSIENYVEIEVVNVKQTGTVEINKVDEKQLPLENAIFALYDENGVEIDRQTSNQNGVALFSQVPVGNYTVKEVVAPNGYKLNPNVFTVALLRQDEVTSLKIVNHKVDLQGINDEKTEETEEIDNNSGETDTGMKNENQTIEEDNNNNTDIKSNNMKNELPKTSDSIMGKLFIFVGSFMILILLVVLRVRKGQTSK